MRELLTIAIADTSVIIRNGVMALLKHFSNVRAQIIEISTVDSLPEMLTAHKPNVLIVNPSLIGCFSLQQLKEECGCLDMKSIALIYTVVDQSLLRQYDDHFHIYDNPEDLRLKLERFQSYLLNGDGYEEPQTLSAREKEIVVCVVKGMTNREIANQLFLSTHTVVTHRRNIARKLQVHSASGLTVYAIVNKLVSLNEIKA